MQSIKVKHNVEMAHRLFETPGKCEKIHGHSWNVELELFGSIDGRGMLNSLDFGIVKQHFRGFLDHEFDHRILLNARDPWAQNIGDMGLLPGLATLPGDPTTENLANGVGSWANQFFGCSKTSVTVWETAVNCATWSSE
jgi:6-pyruvoyltetrahydropterin/6-carboxytetrahydropterin synthase